MAQSTSVIKPLFLHIHLMRAAAAGGDARGVGLGGKALQFLRGARTAQAGQLPVVAHAGKLMAFQKARQLGQALFRCGAHLIEFHRAAAALQVGTAGGLAEQHLVGTP